ADNFLFAIDHLQVGKKAPELLGEDARGKPIRLSQFDGKVVAVVFWATWCVPCRREMPHLQEMTDEFGDQGFLVVGVNTDPPATKSKIKPYLRRLKITYLNLLDPNNNVLDKYNPTRELPYAVLIDREGSVHEVFPGYRAGDEIRLRKTVQTLLDGNVSEHDPDPGE
ncbi:MAG: TlpA family protein disulfide reductase, partial [Acidobacteria bacterium]|nr:TlpA family protein disulfide reductase [Acidobacteriota bacterium]